MSRELNCNSCKKHMATLRDASVRKGMVVYCPSCDLDRTRMEISHYMHKRCKEWDERYEEMKRKELGDV